MDNAAWVREQVEALTRGQESQREKPWHVSDAPEDFIAMQLKAIVGVEIPVETIEGKWKLSQNKLPVDRQGVVDGLKAEDLCPMMVRAMETIISEASDNPQTG